MTEPGPRNHHGRAGGPRRSAAVAAMTSNSPSSCCPRSHFSRCVGLIAVGGMVSLGRLHSGGSVSGALPPVGTPVTCTWTVGLPSIQATKPARQTAPDSPRPCRVAASTPSLVERDRAGGHRRAAISERGVAGPRCFPERFLDQTPPAGTKISISRARRLCDGRAAQTRVMGRGCQRLPPKRDSRHATKCVAWQRRRSFRLIPNG